MKFMALFLILIMFFSCSNKSEQKANLMFYIPPMEKNKVDTSSHLIASSDVIPYAPTDVTGFDCLMINVVGPGIGNWSGNRSRVALGRNFSYVGNFSRMISVVSGGTVEVSVPKGSDRYIQLIGVVSNVGCLSSFSGADLNSVSKFPGLFIAGASQIDVYEDKSLRIQSSYTQSSAGDFRGSETSPIPAGVDTTGPTVSNKVISVTPSVTSVDLSWVSASDNESSASQLEYKVVRSTSTSDLSTVSDAEAATTVMDWTAQTTSKSVTNLSASSSYAFNVIVRDRAGFKTLYTAVSTTTLSDNPTVNSSGTSVTISPSGDQTVSSGSTITYTVTADAGKFLSQTVGGTCPLGSWSGSQYTTGAITSSCSVSFAAYNTVTYTTWYNGNGNTGGSVPRDTNSYTSGQTVTVKGNTGSLTKTSATFAGWNTQSDGCGTDQAVSSTFTITAHKTLYAKWSPIIYVATTGNDTTGSGTTTAPYATIAKALAVIGCPGGKIRVASGSYALSATITMKSNVELLGGYDSSNWSRNISSNQTILTPPATGTFKYISLTSLTGTQLIEGITLRPFATDSNNDYQGIFVSNSPNTAIKNNTIQLNVNNGSVYPIYISGNYNSEIVGNYINAYYNDIDGRYAYGVFIQSLITGSNVKINSNVIDVGTATLINGNPQPIVLKSCTGTYTLYIRNNTIRVGTKATIPTFAFGNELGTPTSNLYFDNNIVFSGPATNGFTNGVYCATGAVCNIQSMKNNNFFNLDSIYQNVDATINYTTVAALNGGLGTATSNISAEMVIAGYFNDYAAEDYRLSASVPASISLGGIDGSSSSWSFTTDADQVTRTGNGTTGWSMGAYEK